VKSTDLKYSRSKPIKQQSKIISMGRSVKLVIIVWDETIKRIIQELKYIYEAKFRTIKLFGLNGQTRVNFETKNANYDWKSDLLMNAEFGL
jgi:hypothetical protein